MYGACKGDMHTVFYSKYLKRRNQTGNMKVDTRIILKLIIGYKGISLANPDLEIRSVGTV
jgi:hypothetical protein